MKLTIKKQRIIILSLLLIFLTTSIAYAESNLPTPTPDIFMLEQIQRVTEAVKVVPPPKPPLTQEQIIDGYVDTICQDYNMDPALIKSVIWHESRYNPNAANGNCLGLMQISTRWHSGRAASLGVTDFYDPYSNILLGVDYLSEILQNCSDPALALMVYNMGGVKARSVYNSGHISNYAQSVLQRADTIR